MAFRYKTKFSSEILGSERVASFDKLGISHASLENLRPLIPPSIDLERNIDLMAVAFNAAVVNRFNKNDDGIDTSTALEIKDYFINKPTNIEHKKQIVVGHIISSSFSTFGDSQLLSDEEVRDTQDPFNIALGSVVYKTVNPRFSELLEAENEEYDNLISTSWELGFNDYCLALGSKNLSEAEIVTDPSQVKELSQYLRAFDGPGETNEGVEVNRLIVGEIFPLGIAFTSNPAADVKGVYIKDGEEELVEEEAVAGIAVDNTIFLTNLKKFNKKSSHCEKSDVNSFNNYTLMDSNILEKFEEILADKLDNKQFSEEAVANVTRVFQEAIREKDEEYRAAKEAEDKAMAESAAKNEQLETDLELLKKQLAEAEAHLASIAEERAAAEAQESFNSRMAGLDSEFELGDEDREILASELKSLDTTEEAFASYLTKLRTVWATKSKAYIEESEKQLQQRIDDEVTKRLTELEQSQASAPAEEVEESVDTEEVLDAAEEQPNGLVTNNNAEASQTEPSLRDRFKNAFSKENLTIKL